MYLAHSSHFSYKKPLKCLINPSIVRRMDNLIVLTGEDKVKKFLRTLNDNEMIELIEEVKGMIEMRSLDIDHIRIKEKPSIEFTQMEESA